MRAVLSSAVLPLSAAYNVTPMQALRAILSLVLTLTVLEVDTKVLAFVRLIVFVIFLDEITRIPRGRRGLNRGACVPVASTVVIAILIAAAAPRTAIRPTTASAILVTLMGVLGPCRQVAQWHVVEEALQGVNHASKRFRPCAAGVPDLSVKRIHNLLELPHSLRVRNPEVCLRINGKLFNTREEVPDVVDVDVGHRLSGIECRQAVVLGPGPNPKSAPPSRLVHLVFLLLVFDAIRLDVDDLRLELVRGRRSVAFIDDHAADTVEFNGAKLPVLEVTNDHTHQTFVAQPVLGDRTMWGELAHAVGHTLELLRGTILLIVERLSELLMNLVFEWHDRLRSQL